jgi:hypothetical protein
MWIRLLKSYTIDNGKKLPIGTIFNKLNYQARALIEQEIAEEYSGSRMNPVKAKTELFKPTKKTKKWQQQAQ